jgi:membrane protease YdiL (CAAX protease family)
LATRVITGEGWKNMYLNPNFKGHGRAYAIVFFAPTVLILLSMGFYFILFQKQFDSELTTFSAVLAQSGQTTGITPQLMLIISLAQMALIGPIINLVPTMGEELGWRGYLLPKLRTLYPDRKAFLISGVIWGVWHAPIIAMGHNYGTAYFGYPWLGILMMIVFCMALGTIEGYASIRMNSAIPAGMIHSAVNAGAALPIYLIQGPYNPIIGPAITGLVGGLPVFLLAAFFWWHSKSKRQPDLGMTDSSVPIA